MPPAQDRILVVENDPIISDLVARQALQGAGYQVTVVGEVNAAINRALRWTPDLIVADLNLPGLSAKDLMVALSSQGLALPVIVLAAKGMEANIIQAFRLGASDYLIWPAREAEVISAVERALRQVHERKERERLSAKLQQTNQEMQNRVRELTTIYSIGKAVTSVTDQALLFEKIVDGAMKVTQAEYGWLLLREDRAKTFTLAAQRNLPPSAGVQLHQPWDDGISSLVALSGEPLSIYGEPIRRFKIASLGQSALIVPIKVQKQVVGLLVTLRKQPLPFTESEQHVLQAVADYASISLVNSHLFRAIEERARAQQLLAENALAADKISTEILQKAQQELQAPIEIAQLALNSLSKDPTARWSPAQRKQLFTIQEQLDALCAVMNAIHLHAGQSANDKTQPFRSFSVNEVVRQAAAQFQPFAEQNKLSLVVDLPSQAVMAFGDPLLTAQAINGLVSNAIKFCNLGGRVLLRAERSPEGLAHVCVEDTGSAIDPAQAERMFQGEEFSDKSQPRRFGGLGISMKLIKEILARQGGSIWVESKPGSGATIHFSLPAPRSTP
jgi:signal transduction histidine kinase/DNA-binding response OmpR family regulator